MTREIKFRAWFLLGKDLPIKRMFYDVQKDTDGLSFDHYLYDSRNDRLHGLSRFIIMQYTGLKDKNGKDIYEGDIVRRCGEETYAIFWHEFTACWLMDKHTGITKSDMALNCEVIGNIHENPELLNKYPK